MAKVSFSKPGGENLATEVEATVVSTPTPGEGVAVESTTTAAAPASAPAPAATQTGSQLPAVIPTGGVTRPLYSDDAEENIDASDLVIPYLSIVQKVGEISNLYPGGTILMGSQNSGHLQLVDAPKGKDLSAPLNLVVLGTRPKRYVEKVEGGARGDMFDNLQDVIACGGTTEYNEAKATGKRLFQTLITALVLIEQPQGTNEASFPFKIEGKRYAMALYSMKGTSYTNAAKHFLSAKKIGWLMGVGFRGGVWSFQSRLEHRNGNYYYIPVVKPGVLTTESFRTAVKNLIGF